MGRLGYSSKPQTRLNKIVRLWGVPLVVSLLIIFVVNATLAFDGPPPAELESFLQTSELVPRTKTIDGYQQIYYVYKGEEVFITKDNINHTNPKSSGRYITWCESNNNDANTSLYLYDVLTGAKVWLTASSPVTDIHMDSNRIVWAQGIRGVKQIMYYDGLGIYQLTDGAADAIRPNIYNDTIAYAQYVDADVQKPWQVVQYHTDSGEYETILSATDGSKAWPHYDESGNLLTKFDLQTLSSY